MKRVFVALFVFCAAAAQAQTVDEILAKYHANIGGVDKLKALKTMKAVGKMSMQGMDLDFNMTMKTPNKQHMTISVQGQQIIQAFDGAEGWAVNPFGGGKEAVKLPAEQTKEMAEQKVEDEFIDYKKKGHEVKLLGKEEVDGTQCYKVELTKNKFNDQEDVTVVYYFDVENYVPIMMISYARTGPMKGAEARTYMSDYQEVNGMMMPFSTEVKANGQTVQKMTFQKVSINENVDDSLFAFPKK